MTDNVGTVYVDQDYCDVATTYYPVLLVGSEPVGDNPLPVKGHRSSLALLARDLDGHVWEITGGNYVPATRAPGEPNLQAKRFVAFRSAVDIESVRPECWEQFQDDELPELGRYVLVETASERYGSDLWITCHHTPESAGQYYDGNECPEDWAGVRLIDLDNPEQLFRDEVRTTFTAVTS